MAIVSKKGLLQGKVSNIVYRNFRGRQVVQFKPSSIKQTIETKEAALEFGLCSASAQVIRSAFKAVYEGYDGAMVNRMTSTVRRSFNASVKPRCERTIHDGELSLFLGFQFNANSAVDKVLRQRPQAQLHDGQLSVSLPQLSLKDIKGPRIDACRIRFMAVSFDFRRRIYRYEGYHEIYVNTDQSYTGGSLLLSDQLPSDRLILLSMSVHGYVSSIDGERMVNSVSWSPAELIGVWHTEPTSEPTATTPPVALQPGLPLFYQNIPMGMNLSDFHRRLDDIHSKERQKKKQAGGGASPGTAIKNAAGGLDLPKGDIGF